MEGFENSRTVPFRKTSILNQNSLQIYYSYRFVFSSSSDFKLVEEMIEKHPEIREGPKMKAS